MRTRYFYLNLERNRTYPFFYEDGAFSDKPIVKMNELNYIYGI